MKENLEVIFFQMTEIFIFVSKLNDQQKRIRNCTFQMPKCHKMELLCFEQSGVEILMPG